jgi:hypothetical protein
MITSAIALEENVIYIGEGVCSFNLDTSNNEVIVNRATQYVELTKLELQILISHLQEFERKLD